MQTFSDRMRRHCCLPLCALLLVLGRPSGFAQSPAAVKPDAKATREARLASRMDAWMSAFARRNLFIGVVLVAKDGTPIFQKAYGCADYGKTPPPPNTVETPMVIFSMTKAFTASCILLLQDQGRLSVHDPVGNYLKGWPAAWKSVTIHHLLTHTSGLDDEQGASWWVMQQKGKFNDPDWKPKPLIHPRLKAPPGERFAYSNLGYTLLAGIVERASGKSFRDFLHDNVFTPLGMQHSDAYQPNVTPVRAHGHMLTGGTPIPVEQGTDFIIGAGDVYTTVGDLLKWEQALRKPGFLSRKSLRAMFTPQEHGYSYGWAIDEQDGTLSVSHGGGGLGFTSEIISLPHRGWTAVVLSNLSGYTDFLFTSTLLEIAQGRAYGPLPFADVPPSRLARYAGEYRRGKDRLHLTPGAAPSSLDLKPQDWKMAFTVYAMQNGRFFGGPLYASFKQDGKGRVTALILNGEAGTRKFKKVRAKRAQAAQR